MPKPAPAPRARMTERDNLACIAVEQLLGQATGGPRFTQDSPVLPDVWINFGAHGKSKDLLLMPHWRRTAHELATALEARLGRHGEGARLAHTQNIVAAELDLLALLRAALPLSNWWHSYLLEPTEGEPPGDLCALMAASLTRDRLRKALLRELRASPTEARPVPLDLATGEPVTPRSRRARTISGDLVWLVSVGGTLARLLEKHPEGLASLSCRSLEAAKKELARFSSPAEDVVDAFLGVFDGVQGQSPETALWSVHLNRTGGLAMTRSTATVKADAARKVFGVGGRNVRWAVVDSGIDATHPAFQRRGPEQKAEDGDWSGRTRILGTYDLTCARALLSARDIPDLPEPMRARVEADPKLRASAVAALEQSAAHGVDWNQWAALLEVPHREGLYEAPRHRHGTHVAGILGADWRPEDDPEDVLEASPAAPRHEQERTGVCPEIEIYDIRVTDASGGCDEFAVIAALQFIRAINARHEYTEIHGVNLSVSLLHDVANYACGRTPVCEECERLVASGVVVVVAAGNQGRARYLTSEGLVDEGYRSISITDPGNAPAVITVGATHRSDPHGFGVSYFSSRGPTGDGRMKPDLVAPGEKVVSTVPGGREEAMDGTSMAAPHVSGAAALLLCRHPELIGRPAEIKRILCSTTVDLGRERSFQGAGLLDILHALESI